MSLFIKCTTCAMALARSPTPAARFRQNNGLIYVRSFFSMEKAAAIRKEVAELRKRAKPEIGSIATGRRGSFIAANSVARTALSSSETGKKLEQLVGQGSLLPAEYPAELRIYPVGASMDWHSDDRLYALPQYELIYTVENCSDSETQWRDRSGQVHSEWTEPNSLLVVHADSVVHRATHVSKGERIILKAIWTPTHRRDPRFEENLRANIYK
jgi:hypothetical protein